MVKKIARYSFRYHSHIIVVRIDFAIHEVDVFRMEIEICAARRIHRNAKTGEKKREREGTAIEELRVLTTEAHFKRTHDAHLSRTPYLFTFESVDMSKSVGPSISNARACTENSPPIHFSSLSLSDNLPVSLLDENNPI